MKLGIAQAYNGEHRHYRAAAKKLGMRAFLFDIDTPNWVKNFKKADAYLWHADTKEEHYRVIHDRIYFIESILKKPVFPDMNMYYAYNDKIKQNDIFNLYGVPTAKTYVAREKQKALDIVNKIKYPFILKDAHGYGGFHVHKIDNKKQARDMIEKIFSPTGLKHHLAVMKDYFLAQEFVPVEKDLRVIVIGDKVACAYWRRAERDWRHNIGLGAQGFFHDIPKRALNFCLKFNKKMKFHWMAYDVFVLKNDRLLMSEFSCNFGIKAPTAAGFNIRKAQVEYIYKYLSRYGKK